VDTGGVLSKGMSASSKIGVGFVALAFLLAAFPSHAASFKVCNKSKERVSVAIGYGDKDLGMVSEGWWKLAISECVNIVPADRTDHQYYFLYARGARGDNWSSYDKTEEGIFCVRKNNFRLINRDFVTGGKLNCEGRSANTIEFRRIDTFNVPKFTYSLTSTSEKK
jgi:uncharacterized membrane protein